MGGGERALKEVLLDQLPGVAWETVKSTAMQHGVWKMSGELSNDTKKGEELRAYRESLGVSRAELGIKCGYGESSIGNVECGRHVSPRAVERMTKALKEIEYEMKKGTVEELEKRPLPSKAVVQHVIENAPKDGEKEPEVPKAYFQPSEYSVAALKVFVELVKNTFDECAVCYDDAVGIVLAVENIKEDIENMMEYNPMNHIKLAGTEARLQRLMVVGEASDEVLHIGTDDGNA